MGRGVVIPGGGAFALGAWVTVRMIRHFGCTLPIEVWCLPWESIDPEPFLPYNVTIRVATPGFCQRSPVYGFGKNIFPAGWQLKVQAVLWSSFREVVYFDADCYPLNSTWEFLQSATFLADITSSHHLLPRTTSTLTPIDSGAFVVTKGEWCKYMYALNHADNYRERFYGDKDTWTYAHHLTGTPFITLNGAQHIGNGSAIWHPVGFLHRCCSKFNTSVNTPQIKIPPPLPGDGIVLPIVNEGRLLFRSVLPS